MPSPAEDVWNAGSSLVVALAVAVATHLYQPFGYFVIEALSYVPLTDPSPLNTKLAEISMPPPSRISPFILNPVKSE